MDAAAIVHRPATPSPLSFVALLVAGLIFLPLLYVISLAVGADGAIWSRLWRTRIPELLANTAALAADVAVEEVARACGATRYDTLRRVTLPLLRPAIVAGLSLVILYVVSDFGAVS